MKNKENYSNETLSGLSRTYPGIAGVGAYKEKEFREQNPTADDSRANLVATTAIKDFLRGPQVDNLIKEIPTNPLNERNAEASIQPKGRTEENFRVVRRPDEDYWAEPGVPRTTVTSNKTKTYETEPKLIPKPEPREPGYIDK